MKSWTTRFFLLSCVFWALGCAGYRLGSSKPDALAHVNRIHLPLAGNETQIPRAGALTTNSVSDAITRDGTYTLSSREGADAILEVSLHTINYSAVRTTSTNRLLPEELSMELILRWKVIDASDPLRVLDSGQSVGRTRFFVDPNIQTARQSAITDALQRASVSLVGRLADGF